MEKGIGLITEANYIYFFFNLPREKAESNTVILLKKRRSRRKSGTAVIKGIGSGIKFHQYNFSLLIPALYSNYSVAICSLCSSVVAFKLPL